MYKHYDLGYNRYPMAATRATPAAPYMETRKGFQGRRAVLLVLGFFVCLLVVNSLVGERGAIALVRTRQQNAALAREVARKKAENDVMREAIYRLQYDPTAIEEIARRELGLIKRGEKVFIVRDVPPASHH